jgi:hypothetical protein
MTDKQQFPSEMIDLPSEGKLYPKDSPLSSGRLEIKYMTAKEEDILTSQNLLKKGLIVQKLLNSLIMTEGVRYEDLVIGDKNAIMVAARVLAYGPEYQTEVTNPTTGEKITHVFNLAECPFKKLPEGVVSNEFDMELPISKAKIKYKLLTGRDENIIDSELNALKKINSQIIPELTTRLKHIITEVNGSSEQPIINNFVDNMLSRDSLHLRQSLMEIAPDIEMQQTIEIEGEQVKVHIPLTSDFFWPNSQPQIDNT